MAKENKPKRFTPKEIVSLIIGFLILLLVMFSPIILQIKDHNILTALLYIILSVPILIVSIVALEAFEHIPYFKQKGDFKSKVRANGYNMFFMFMLYALLIQAFSRFLFITLKGFLSADILAFYPERSLLLLPAFCAIVIFSIRFIPLFNKKTEKFLNERKKDLDLLSIISPKKYIGAIQTVLKDFVIATLLIGYILIIVYNYYGDLSYNYQRQLIIIPLIYAFVFWIIDFIIGIITTDTKPLILKEEVKAEKEEDKPSHLDKYPKIKKFFEKYMNIIFIILLIIFFCFVAYKASIFIKTPYQNTTISNWAYEINLDKNSSYNLSKIVFSDYVTQIKENSSLNLATSIVLFNGQEYPLSKRLNDQYQKGIIDLEKTNESIIQDIKGIEANITVKHKQNINLSEKELPNLYYFTTEYDLPLFIALYNNGYKKLYSQGYSRPSPTIQQFVKRICTTNGNSTVFVYINFEGESVLFKDMYIYSEDQKLNSDIEKGFSRLEGLSLRFDNSTLSCDNLYNYELK